MTHATLFYNSLELATHSTSILLHNRNWHAKNSYANKVESREGWSPRDEIQRSTTQNTFTSHIAYVTNKYFALYFSRLDEDHYFTIVLRMKN